jgi:serine/threonine-protein kinase
MYDSTAAKAEPRVLGRYCLYDEIAAGGMATVHFGRLLGPAGFSRTVAIKQLHPQYARDPEFVAMFLDEARLAARIRHPNVVSTIDVVARDGELFLVMEYIQGEAFARLLRTASLAGERVPPEVASSVVVQALLGLHAAHEALDEKGAVLNIVHRDVSPQNILVGTDGVARVLDFGVAKATSRLQTTQDGRLKGKLAYMAPEQLLKRAVDRRADIFAAATVLWEALCGDRLFAGDDAAAAVAHILDGEVKAPSSIVADLPSELDAVVLKGLAKEPTERYQTAKEMAQALERALPPAGALRVSDWVEHTAGMSLRQRAERVAQIEDTSSNLLANGGRETVDSLLGPLTPSGRSAARPSNLHEADTRTDIDTGRPSRNPMPSSPHVATTHSSAIELPTGLTRVKTLRRRWILALLALLAMITVAVVLIGVGTGAEAISGHATRADGNRSEPTRATPVMPAEPGPTPASAGREPPSAVGVTPQPAGSTPAITAPQNGSSPARTAEKPPARKPTRRPNCTVPYVIDADGSKRFKPECFQD